MTTKKSTEGVGKKIVEALKKQSAPIIEEPEETVQIDESDLDYQDDTASSIDSIFAEEEPTSHIDTIEQPTIDTSFLNNSSFTTGGVNVEDTKQYFQPQPQTQNYTREPELKMDNVKVLSNLINQLPAGISKQTGAQIIKQTMEALGISMKTVLTEAQQIQEKISMSSNECLSSIQEYKKQILAMEKQVQQYHKQYNALNELISLFVQTGI